MLEALNLKQTFSLSDLYKTFTIDFIIIEDQSDGHHGSSHRSKVAEFDCGD